jgi:hypothetical protein
MDPVTAEVATMPELVGTRRTHVVVGCVAVLALAISGTLGVAGAHGGTASSLSMRAAGPTGSHVQGGGQFVVGGNTSVKISVASLSGGKARVAAGPSRALPRAVDFPSYVASGSYPRAVVRLAPASGGALSPGAGGFEFGAVLRLDAASSGRSVDNGNNLLQRGLYGDSSQFKLQLDGGYPSCLVRGSSGQVSVRSATKVASNSWYTVTCSRVGTRVSIKVQRYGSSAAPASRSAGGSTGTVTFRTSVPASIGGKLTSAGSVASSTDQFNGAVARAWVRRH